MKIQDLLAPTWGERKKAIKQIFGKLENISEDALKSEIIRLHPTPKVFLSHFIAFWADVALEELYFRMTYFGDMDIDKSEYPALSQSWQSPYREVDYKVDIDIKENDIFILLLPHLIKKLAKYIETDNHQLLACLNHPDMLVRDTVNTLLSYKKEMEHDEFLKLLAKADREGGDGMVNERSKTIIKYMNPSRLDLILNGITPQSTKNSINARYNIIKFLEGEYLPQAYEYLLKHISLAWNEHQRMKLFYALADVSEVLGFTDAFIQEVIDYKDTEDKHLKASVAYVLASHSPKKHFDLIKLLLKDAHHWVLMSLCSGFERHQELPSELFYDVISQSLDNYDACDGYPHYSAVSLIVSQREKAFCVIDIIKKWLENLIAQSDTENEEIRDAVSIVQALGEKGISLRPLLKTITQRCIDEYALDGEDAREYLYENLDLEVPELFG